MKALLHIILQLDTDFKKLFFAREFRALSGPKAINIAFLTAIVLLTIAALAFASGSLKKLARRMDDPFTNWVNLDVRNQDVTAKVPDICDRFLADTARHRFALNGIGVYSRFWFTIYQKRFDPFANAPDDMSFDVIGRTIEIDDPLLDKIFAPTEANVVVPPANPIEDALSENPCGIIVKEEMLRQLGFEPAADSLPTLLMLTKGKNPQLVFLEVLAVVRELPNLCNFLCQPRLYNIVASGGKGIEHCGDLIAQGVVANGSKNNFKFWGEPGSSDALQQEAEAFFTGKRPGTDAQPLRTFRGKEYELSLLSFPVTERPDSAAIRQFAASMRGKGLLPYSELICGADGCNENIDPNYVAFHFDQLDHIEAFRNALKSEFGENISMEQVESKKNFALVSRLTQFISSVLLLFGITSVALFVYNLLKSHLMQIRPNIGTFAAFGLSEGFIIRVYQKMTLTFVLLAVAIAFGIAAIGDGAGRYLLGEETSFDTFNWWVFGAMAGLVAAAYQISGWTVSRILKDTPGNLIYER